MEKELIVCRCEEILKEEGVDAICKEARSLSAIKQRIGT
jgi:hypothetical protein